MELAREVVRLCEVPNDFTYSYDLEMPILDKLNAIATKIYRADGADLIGDAPKQLKQLEQSGTQLRTVFGDEFHTKGEALDFAEQFLDGLQ